MGEDPIIVKPGVYLASDGSEKKGICFVFDDDSWNITKDAAGKITITIPPDSKWLVEDDFTPPKPVPPVTEDPPVTRKKKVAVIRKEGTLAGVNLREVRILESVNNPIDGDMTISFTAPPTGGGPGPA